MTSCIVGLQMGLLLFLLPNICSFIFLSRFFVKNMSTTVSDRNFKFGIEVRNDKLYCGNANGHSPICSSLPFFFVSRFFVKDISTTVIDRNYKFWYRGSQRQVALWDCKWAFSYLFFHIFVLFSVSPDFSSKISPQPFKIETSNLV